jgi:hypothetical protein
MDFEYFDALDEVGARDYLAGFLEVESVAVERLVHDPALEGVSLDFSMRSLPIVLKRLIQYIRYTRTPVPDSEPEWIREAHKEGILKFDEMSKVVILRAGYYLGECFVKNYPPLYWSIGNPEFAEKNMPVVTGFKFEMELAPLMVVENIYSRILRRAGSDSAVDVMVNEWQKWAP